MRWILRRLHRAAVLTLCVAVLGAAAPPLGSPASAAGPLPGSPLGAVMTVAFDDQPIERQVGGFTKSLFREIRRSFRMLQWMFWRALDWWGGWARRLAFSVGVAIVALLADGSLLAAWRSEGLRSLLTNSVLMLYVYGRLLFSGGVNFLPKLLLLGALVYGVVRRDLVPDRSLWPGRIEDILLIVIAARSFVYACPQELVNEYAARAVTLKRRVAGAR